MVIAAAAVGIVACAAFLWVERHTLGYTAIQAGAATLPITLLLLAFSVPSGALAQRIGPRIPLTLGSLVTGAGLLLMSRESRPAMPTSRE